jgi:flavin reductase (DIM6/NTAB) family NADH-FMN oxidoreductase RutF
VQLMSTRNEVALGLRDRFRDAMRQVAAPVCVVTTMGDSGPHGTTVSAFASLSMNPPMLMLSLDNSSRLLARVGVGVRLGINVLAVDQHELATRFAGKAEEKFDGVEWSLDEGAPRLDGCPSWVVIDIRQVIPGGDHMVVLGVVRHAVACDGHLPLTYHDRKFGTHTQL